MNIVIAISDELGALATTAAAEVAKEPLEDYLFDKIIGLIRNYKYETLEAPMRAVLKTEKEKVNADLEKAKNDHKNK